MNVPRYSRYLNEIMMTLYRYNLITATVDVIANVQFNQAFKLLNQFYDLFALQYRYGT